MSSKGNRSLRVLQLNSPYRQYGGEDRTAEVLGDMLRELGHEVRQHEAGNQKGHLSTATSLATSAWNPVQAARVRRVIKKWKPDAAQVHNLWFGLSPSVLEVLRQERIPVVLIMANYRLFCASADFWRDDRPCHDCLKMGTSKPGVLHACYRNSRALSAMSAAAAFRQRRVIEQLDSSLVVVPSEFLKGVLIEGGLPPEQLRILPRVTSDPGARAEPPSESRDVYFVGRLAIQNKGIERLVSNWNRIKQEGRLEGLTLRIIGTGPLEGSSAISGTDAVALGKMDKLQVANALLSGRAAIVPSLAEETFGRTVIEAFAAGLPVLGSNRGALPETVGRQGDAFIFDPDDEESWSTALHRLDDDSFVDNGGRKARELFETSYCVERGADQLQSVYLELMNQQVQEI